MIWDLPLSWALGSTFCFLILIIELGFPETNQIVVLQTLSLKQAVLEWIWGFYGGYRFSAIGIPPNDWAVQILKACTAALPLCQLLTILCQRNLVKDGGLPTANL